MLFSNPISFALAAILVVIPFCSASTRLIESKSLNPCMEGSKFTASLFNVVFTPDNNTLAFDVVGVSSIAGNVTANLEVIVYGFSALRHNLDPCSSGFQGMCPMSTGQIDINSNVILSKDVVSKIPSMFKFVGWKK